MDKRIRYITIFITSFLFLLILLANVKRSLNLGLPTYDYGIYQQAVFEIGNQKKLNPFMSVRDEFVFNDHLMPILFTAVPFAAITNYANWFLASFEWSWIVLLFLLVLYLTRNFEEEERWIAVLSVPFCKGILVALHFTAHPGVWSGVAWLCIVYFILKDSYKGIVFSCLALLLFRESYGFCLLTLSFFYLINRKTKTGLTLLFISLSYLIFLFFGREKIIGPSYNYGNRLLGHILSNPWVEIPNLFKHFGYKPFLKLIFPYLIPLYYVFQKYKKDKLSSPLVGVLFLIAPYYAMHFIANKFNYQYGLAAVVPLFSLILFSRVFKTIYEEKKWLYFVCALLIFLNGSGFQTRFVKMAFQKYETGSYFKGRYRDEMPKFVSVLKTIPKDSSIISTSRLTPSLYRPGMTNLHTYEEFMNPRESFDYLLYEKGKTLYLSGKTYLKDTKIKDFCGSMIEEVLYDSENFFLAKGRFLRSCYKMNYL